MKTNLLKILFTKTIFLLFSMTLVFGQAKINPFSIKSSTLFEDLKILRSQNPKMTTAEFVSSANSLLQKQGLNFIFAFDANFCQKVVDVKNKQKDPNSKINLNAKLASVGGETTAVTLPEVRFEKDGCGRCFVEMPVLEMTANEFVTIIQNSNIKFRLPRDFILNETVLVDSQTLKTNVRAWKTPFRAIPLSVTGDGKMLILDLPVKELADLALIFDADGAFQFYAKKDLNLTEKGVLIKDIPKPFDASDASFVGFGTGEKLRVLKFNNPGE